MEYFLLLRLFFRSLLSYATRPNPLIFAVCQYPLQLRNVRSANLHNHLTNGLSNGCNITDLPNSLCPETALATAAMSY